MKVIYLAYANSEEHPLKSLKDENSRINKILVDRKKAGHFLLETDSYATIESIAGYLNKHREELEFFGFSGHAGRDALIAEDAPAHAGGIAHLLSLCPNLKVVFLNGCSTAGQVKILLEKGIPVVIATHSPVDDGLAKDFAVALFKALGENRTLEDSFEHAKGFILAKRHEVQFEVYRDLADDPEEGELWGIFGKKDVAREWRLPSGLPEKILNKILSEAQPGKTKLFFIGNKETREKYYLKIKASFGEEQEFLFNDIFGISEEIEKEAVTSEVEAADVLIFMFNGLDFYTFWDKISWREEIVRRFDKPVVFIKISGDNETINGFIEKLGLPHEVVPNYREMFQYLPDAGLENYIVSSFKDELKKCIFAISRRQGVAPERLQEELLDFDLGPQTSEFKEFLRKGWRYNLALVQGTDRCGQGLLLNRLTSYLTNKFLKCHVDFCASEGPVTTEALLWERLCEFLIQAHLNTPEIIVPILGERLRHQDILIILENVCTPEMSEETAQGNMAIISGFWKKVVSLLPSDPAPPYSLYVFAVNRACHCGVNFENIDAAADNPESQSMLLQIHPIDEAVFSEWHQEKQRRFREQPAFLQLPANMESIVGDGYLSDVVYRICENLNCVSVHAKLNHL